MRKKRDIVTWKQITIYGKDKGEKYRENAIRIKNETKQIKRKRDSNEKFKYYICMYMRIKTDD